MKLTYFFSNNFCCLNIHKKLLYLKGTDFGYNKEKIITYSFNNISGKTTKAAQL